MRRGAGHGPGGIRGPELAPAVPGEGAERTRPRVRTRAGERP